MEFATYHNPYNLTTEELRTVPRIGTLRVADDFASSDGNFYPNHETFGKSKAGAYPLYGKFLPNTPPGNRPTGLFLSSAYADIPGVAHNGAAFTYVHRIEGYDVAKYVGEGQEHHGTTFRVELDPPFSLDGNGKVVGYDPDWLDPIILDPAKSGPNADRDVWILNKDVSRRMGILICGHEFTLVLNEDLSFSHAESIDLGDAGEYATEAEFEAAFPGAMAAIRKAKDQGVLRAYHYEWDGKRNMRSVVPFPG